MSASTRRNGERGWLTLVTISKRVAAVHVAPVALAVLVLSAGCGGGAPPGGAAGASAAGGKGGGARKAPVEVELAERRTVPYTIETVGELQADEVVRIPARVGGVIESIAFREGTRVEPATVLARIDPERYRLAFARAEAATAEAAAQLSEAEAALDKRRALRARDPGWVSEEELSNFGARVEEKRAALAASRAALELARKDLGDSTVRAGATGIINQKLVDTGQYLTAGTPIATLVDTRKLRLSFKVSESESVRLGQAQGIRFRVRSLPGREFSARLYHLGESAESGTRMVPCLAWVEGDPSALAELRPGSFTDVSVLVETRESIVIPTTAVLPSDRGFITWVMTGEASAEPRTLELGLNTKDGKVEIRSGIETGDRVIVRGGAALKPGMPIQVVAKAVEKAAEQGAEKGEAGPR